MSKDVIEGAVEQKVTGRIDGQQEIGYLSDPADEVVALVVTKPEDRRHYGVRGDADDEDGDDGDEHQGDAVTLGHLLVRPGGWSVATTGASESLDDEAVERAEDGQRHDGAKQVLCPCIGHDEVLVSPECSQLQQQQQ